MQAKPVAAAAQIDLDVNQPSKYCDRYNIQLYQASFAVLAK